MSDPEHIDDIRQFVAEVLDGSDEEQTLCASFLLAGEEAPWVQFVPGLLNVCWPWDDEDPLPRLQEACGDRLPTEAAVESAEPGLFATFEIGALEVSALAELIDHVFLTVHGLEPGYHLDVEVYPIQDDEIPDRVPIAREAEYHTDRIGTFDGGHQFMAFVVATLPEDKIGADDWEAHKRWYAVLHRFDEEGVHTGTEAEFVGTTAEGEPEVTQRADARVAEMIAELGAVKYGDVAIQLFSTTIDGHEFGLVDATYEDEEEGEVFVQAELRPNELVFFPPWDGTYDT